MFHDLPSFINSLRKEREIIDIRVPVNPYLEAAEIHRRVVATQGPALFFHKIQGSDFPLVTNLFGTKRRVEMAFGSRPEQLVERLAKLPEELMPPSVLKLWHERSTLKQLLKVGLRKKRKASVCQIIDQPPKLSRLPLLTTWLEDGGPFITLPLVYTEHPETGVHNLGMYRLQRFDDYTTGLHCQIGKGGGFHLAAAESLGKKLQTRLKQTKN